MDTKGLHCKAVNHLFFAMVFVMSLWLFGLDTRYSNIKYNKSLFENKTIWRNWNLINTVSYNFKTGFSSIFQASSTSNTPFCVFSEFLLNHALQDYQISSWTIKHLF